MADDDWGQNDTVVTPAAKPTQGAEAWGQNDTVVTPAAKPSEAPKGFPYDEPGKVYSESPFVPLARDVATGRNEWAVPGPIRSMVRGFLAPGDVYSGRRTDIAAAAGDTANLMGLAGESPPRETVTTLTRPEAAQRLADLQASNITPNVPAVTGSKTFGNAAQAVSNVPFLGEPVPAGIKQNVAEAAQQSRNIASTFGDAAKPEEGGAALQAGRQQFQYGPEGAAKPTLQQAVSTPTRNIGLVPKSEQLYDAIPIEGSQPAATGSTLEKLSELRDRFESNPKLGRELQNPAFSRFFNAIEPKTEEIPPVMSSLVDSSGQPIVKTPGQTVQTGGLSWDDLRSLRSYVGQQMRQPAGQLGVGPDEWRSLYGAISQDIKDTASDQGPEALKAFDRANNYYSAGLKRLNDAMGFIEKADSPEKAYYGLTAKGAEQGKGASIDQLTAVMKSLPDEMKGDVASTVINRLGVAKPNADGINPDKFSVGTWATNYATLSDKAKDALFGTVGTAQRDSLDTLGRAMTSLKNVDRLGNPSGTARVGTALLAGPAALHGAAVAPFQTALAAASTYGGAKALMSPAVARWLANASKTTTPEGWSVNLARLGSIAQREPAAAAIYGALTQPQSQQ